EEEEIVVKGSKPNSVDEGGDGNMGGPGGGFYPGGPEGPSVGEGGGETLSEQQQNDCRDRNALTAEGQIEDMPDNGSKEYGSVIYRDASGAVRHSAPIPGPGPRITLEAVLGWLSTNGVAISQVIGFVHNHPEAEYGQTGDEARGNRYPSDNDWNFAEYMVNHGADPGFALYLMDTKDKMREFEYADRSTYESLSWADKTSLYGRDLPPVMQSDGTSCG
ncbi:MAG TPA: hypothetical protein VJS15_09465, partial [Allosphingosinicella sp.]|nr:hypothetical protein [Allosphingosinicella sp.]